MAIEFHSEEIDFQIDYTEKASIALEKLIVLEGFSVGDINIIFCSDDYLLNVNKEYLNHDYYTDIITFNYNEQDEISGDLFVSVDRVVENAVSNDIGFENELKRVMAHGVLHLVGYNDKTDEEVKEMRSKEDYYLKLF